jgi:hypothetical protein
MKAKFVFILGFPAYFLYYNLTEADFLSTNLCLETPDQENMLIDQ